MRRRDVVTMLFAVLLMLALAGCGNPNNVAHVQAHHIEGFWSGLWDGMTAIFAFFLNLVGLGHYNIYEVHNNGGWYNFGFLLGIGALSFGSVSGSVSVGRRS
jgi:hypothetical protein